MLSLFGATGPFNRLLAAEIYCYSVGLGLENSSSTIDRTSTASHSTSSKHRAFHDHGTGLYNLMHHYFVIPICFYYSFYWSD